MNERKREMGFCVTWKQFRFQVTFPPVMLICFKFRYVQISFNHDLLFMQCLFPHHISCGDQCDLTRKGLISLISPSDLTCLLTAVWPLFLSSLSVTSLSSLLLSSLCSTVFSSTITLTCTQQQLGLDHVKSHLVTFLTNKLIFEFQAKYGCKLNTIFSPRHTW